MSQYVAPSADTENQKYKSKAQLAYEMVMKSKCTAGLAAQSYKVSVQSIREYAKENKLPFVWKADGLVEQAKQLVASGNYKNVRHGLRTRVAYELAKQYGVSEACRMTGTTRRGLYYYCDRHGIPTPARSLMDEGGQS